MINVKYQFAGMTVPSLAYGGKIQFGNVQCRKSYYTKKFHDQGKIFSDRGNVLNRNLQSGFPHEGRGSATPAWVCAKQSK